MFIKLKKTYINYLITIILALILSIIVIGYFLSSINFVIEFLILLFKIVIIIAMSIIPTASIYAIFKNQKNLLFVSAIGSLLFFFLVILLGKINSDIIIDVYSEGQLILFIFFIISFFCFIEFSISSIFFSSAFYKMTINNNFDENIISSYDKVIKRYLLILSFFILFSLGLFLLIFFTIDYNISIAMNNFFGITVNSIYGILFLTIIIIFSSFFLWFLIPREKKKKSKKNS